MENEKIGIYIDGEGGKEVKVKDTDKSELVFHLEQEGRLGPDGRHPGYWTYRGRRLQRQPRWVVEIDLT